MNNPLKYVDPTGKLFKEIFGIVGAVMHIVPFITDVFLYGPVQAWENYKKGVRSFWDAGKSLDDIIFGRKTNSSAQITSQPGFKGTFSTVIGDETYKYYVFDDLKGAVNFMWEESEKSKKEIVCYVLEDQNGKRYYYVFDWNNNPVNKSVNPSVRENPKKKGTYTFDEKLIIAQIHTHPSAFYEQKGRPNGYDGPSYDDYLFTNRRNIPVYTIGPHSVSLISPNQKIMSDKDFEILAEKDYLNPLSADRNVNPFAIMPRQVWLEKPFLYEFTWK